MSAYRGRTGPNFSQYLTDLNQLSPPEHQFIEDNDFNNDLAMYTNTDFTNLDMPGFGDDGYNFDSSADTVEQNDLKYEELLSGTVPSTDFDNVAIPSQTQPYYPTFNTPIQPAPTSASAFPVVDSAQSAGLRDNKRQRADTVDSSDNLGMDEKSRLAADEDKRRRNTAASARFRVKKKQREQALERTLKDTNDKNSKLEARLAQLEMENKWLKDLITEKKGLHSKEEMAAAYEQHRKESEDRELKQEPNHTSGVGTD